MTEGDVVTINGWPTPTRYRCRRGHESDGVSFAIEAPPGSERVFVCLECFKNRIVQNSLETFLVEKP